MSYLPNRTLFLASALLTCALLALLAGCAAPTLPGLQQPTAAPTAAPPTATPLPRGGDLALRLDADVPNLRPWQPRSRGEEQLIDLLYSGLTRLDPTLAPQPDLASEWQTSADGRLITFTLRSGLSWHDGEPLTSEDVAYTLGALRAISPTTALLSDLQRVAEVSTPTPTTVAISMTERYAPIFSILSVPILPKHLLIAKDIATFDFWQMPIGSGPFQLEQRQPGASIALRSSPRFYRDTPLLDRVIFVVEPDAQAAAAALGRGELQLAELPWGVAQGLDAQAPGAQRGAYAENSYYFVAMNARPGRPTAEVRVRQALAAAIDLPLLVAGVTGGAGRPIASSAAPGSWADLTQVPTGTLDLDRARLLLDEAGWKVPSGGGLRQRNGATLTLQLFVREDDPRRVRAAEAIADAVEQVGVQIQVQQVDFESGIRARYGPPYDFDLLLGSWSNGAGDPAFADYAFYDPDDFALFHSSQINQGIADTRPVLNITGFSDPTYDVQAAAARQIYTPADRAKAIALAQRRVQELAPYLFLWSDQVVVAAAPQVATLDGPVDLASPSYLWNIERWYLRP